MSELKTDGIEFSTHDDSYRGNQGGIWGGAVGGFVGGGILGYVLGRNQRSGWGYNHPGEWNGGCPVVNNGCSENQPVNRFELQQAEKVSALESKLAREQSERYADSVATSAFKDMVAYFDKNIASRDNLLGDVARTVATLSTKEAVNNEKLNCLRDKVSGAYAEIDELAKDTQRALKTNKVEIESWVNNNFIRQPRVKLCCGTPSWACDGSDEVEN